MCDVPDNLPMDNAEIAWNRNHPYEADAPRYTRDDMEPAEDELTDDDDDATYFNDNED